MLRKCRDTFIDPMKHVFSAALVLTPEKELAEALGYHFGSIFAIFPTDLSQACVAAPGSASSSASAGAQSKNISTTLSHLLWQQVCRVIVRYLCEVMIVIHLYIGVGYVCVCVYIFIIFKILFV